MGFSSWPAEAVAFFTGLQADNTKAYWTANKARYKASVRWSMAELLGELDAEFGPARIARPYRDMRFAAGRAPYRTEIYAIFDRGGYVNFSAAQLDRYRRTVDAEAEGTALAGDRVAEFFRTAAPLRHWLERNVGADPG